MLGGHLRTSDWPQTWLPHTFHLQALYKLLSLSVMELPPAGDDVRATSATLHHLKSHALSKHGPLYRVTCLVSSQNLLACTPLLLCVLCCRP